MALNNKIYILGGLADNGSEYTDRYVQIYDEASNNWSVGARSSPHRSAYAAVAAGGYIYRIGGKPRLSGAKTTVDLYNPTLDQWNNPSDPADYLWEVVWPCAGEIGGKIYVAGGISGTARSNAAVYDPSMDTWSDAGMADLPVTLWGAADLILEGKLYCAGGVQNDQVSAAVWAYDPVADRWTREGDIGQARYRLEGDTLSEAGYAEAGWNPTFSYADSTLDRTIACSGCQPTSVVLASFGGRPVPGGVLLVWETENEVDNLGFHLYRSTFPDALGERLNDVLIPSRSPGEGQGALYEFLDDTARPGVSYHYTLEDVDAGGTRTPHGPVVLTLWRACLPLVFR